MEPPLWLAFAAGTTGGFFNTITGYPLDTVKTRIQTGRQEHLFRGLYRGMTAPLSSVMPFWGMLYGGYKVGRWIRPADDTASIVFAGTLAGLFGSVVWVPMQAVKSVAQDRRCSSRDAFHIVIKRAGLSGLFRGYFVNLFFALPGSAAFYWTMEQTKQSERLVDFWWAPIVAGGIGGLVEWTVGLPGDTARTRYQTSFHYTSSKTCAGELWRLEGIRGFYRGYSAALPRAFICNAAALAGIELVYSAHRIVSA